ncbi:MAG: isochorismate synthase MenF, partial [Dehalococcoidia bacterium]
MVGLGEAFVYRCDGEKRFSDVKETYQRLVSDAAVEGPEVEPLAFTGFRFDPSTEVGAEWKDFGGGLLVLPQLLYARTARGRWVTENIVVQPNGVGQTPIPKTGHQISALRRDERVTRAWWRDSVKGILDRIKQGELEKVVLARKVLQRCTRSISISKVLGRLMTSDPGCTVFAFSRGDACFLGASPELLVRVSGDRVESVCLAGSAPRGTTPEEDRRLGAVLLQDVKELREHSLVVREVARVLGRLCLDLEWGDTPRLMKLGSVQHLATTFRGINGSRSHILDFVRHLHPTAAVAGSPRRKALDVIRETEGMDRGWYAGPVGWIDGGGGGEFTVAIRSALVRPEGAVLYSGAGIVEGSDSEKEYAETELKLSSLLDALRG